MVETEYPLFGSFWSTHLGFPYFQLNTNISFVIYSAIGDASICNNPTPGINGFYHVKKSISVLWLQICVEFPVFANVANRDPLFSDKPKSYLLVVYRYLTIHKNLLIPMGWEPSRNQKCLLIKILLYITTIYYDVNWTSINHIPDIPSNITISPVLSHKMVCPHCPHSPYFSSCLMKYI